MVKATKETQNPSSFRLRHDVKEALVGLTDAVNKQLNIELSMTQILELLIMDAAKSDGKKVIALIKS